MIRKVSKSDIFSETALPVLLALCQLVLAAVLAELASARISAAVRLAMADSTAVL